MPTRPSRRRQLVRLARIAVAAGLVCLLLVSIGPSTVVTTVASASPIPALCAVLLLAALFLLGGLNVWLLLSALHRLSFGAFLRAYTFSWAASIVTPGQLGDATITVFLKRQGIPASKSAAAYLVDKVVSLSILLAVCWCGAPLVVPGMTSSSFLLVPAVGLLLAGLGAGALRLCPRGIPVLETMRAWLRTCLREVGAFRRHKSVMALNMTVTVVKWGILSAVYSVAFRAFGAVVPWPAVGIIPLLSTLVGYVPVSVAGLGTVEITAVYLFGQQGVDQATVVSTYIMLRLCQYVIAAVLVAGLRVAHTGREPEAHCQPAND